MNGNGKEAANRDTYVARNKGEIVEKIRPIQGLVFVLHLEYHRGDRVLQVVHSHYYGLQGRVQLLLLPLHRVIFIMKRNWMRISLYSLRKVAKRVSSFTRLTLVHGISRSLGWSYTGCPIHSRYREFEKFDIISILSRKKNITKIMFMFGFSGLFHVV